MTSQESLAYIHHRLDKVKTHTDPIFHRKAETLLIKASKGTPRVLNTLCTNALIAGVGNQEKPVSARIVKQVTDNLLGTRSTSVGSRPWRYLAIALGLILLLGVLWLSPLGKVVATGPTMLAARESLLARLQGVIPPWGRVTPPDREKSPIAENPKLVNPPAGTTDTPPVNPITQSEPPSRPISNDQPPAVDQPPLAQPSDDRLQNGAQPETTQKEPDDTGSFPLTISVSPGEDISDIALEIYGFANDELFDLIKRNNPDIPDLNAIQVGDKLVLPALPKELEKFRGS